MVMNVWCLESIVNGSEITMRTNIHAAYEPFRLGNSLRFLGASS